MTVHRWRRNPDDFATRVDVDDIPGFFQKDLVVEPGTRAIILADGRNLAGELGPGRYPMQSLSDKLLGPLGAARTMTALLVDVGEVDMEFNVDLRPAVSLKAELRAAVKLDNALSFFINLMKGRPRYTRDELRHYLEPEVRDAVREAVKGIPTGDLGGDLVNKERLAQSIELHMEKTSQAVGLKLERVRALQFSTDGKGDSPGDVGGGVSATASTGPVTIVVPPGSGYNWLPIILLTTVLVILVIIAIAAALAIVFRSSGNGRSVVTPIILPTSTPVTTTPGPTTPPPTISRPTIPPPTIPRPTVLTPTTPRPTVPPIEPTRPAGLTGRIAFSMIKPATGRWGIYIVNANGTGSPREIAEGARQPCFSPDGQLLAVNGQDRPNQENLLVMDTNGGNVREVSRHLEDARPNWSPNGQPFLLYDHEPRHELRILTDFTSRAYEVLRAGPGVIYMGYYPTWMPDGRIIFQGENFWETGARRAGLYVTANSVGVPPGDIGLPTQVTSHGNDIAPVVYGNRVVFMSQREEEGDWEIYTVSLGGVDANLKQLTQNSFHDGIPTWSPDGQWIAFVSNEGGSWGIWAMRPDGSGRRLIVNLGAGAFDGSWTGERISWAQ